MILIDSDVLIWLTNGNYALGNEGFAAQVTAALGRRGTRKIGATTSAAGVRVEEIV